MLALQHFKCHLVVLVLDEAKAQRLLVLLVATELEEYDLSELGKIIDEGVWVKLELLSSILTGTPPIKSLFSVHMPVSTCILLETAYPSGRYTRLFKAKRIRKSKSKLHHQGL